MVQPLFPGNMIHRMQIRKLKARQNYVTTLFIKTRIALLRGL